MSLLFFTQNSSDKISFSFFLKYNVVFHRDVNKYLNDVFGSEMFWTLCSADNDHTKITLKIEP